MKNVTFSAKLICFLCFLPTLLTAQSLADKADSLLSAYHKQDLFSGTVIIAQSGKTLFEKSYGWADREAAVPNTSDTQYRIGSLTKPFTAMLIMQLVEKGKLNLQDPLSKYIPGFSKGDSVTIEQLLNHTSGIRSITSTNRYRNDRKSIKAEADVLDILRAEPFAFSPGSKWQYSNSNYMLLSYIAETISGRPMRQLVSDFAGTQGMKSTGMDYDGRKAPRKAIGYEAGAIDDYIPLTDNNVTIISGAGGIYSTASDLLKLDRALYTKAILSDAAKKRMFTPIKGDYGLGWETGNYKGRAELGHSGSIEGFKAMMLRYPESETCIIFLSNYWNTPGAAICESLKAIAFGEDYKLPDARQFLTLTTDQLKAYEGDYSFKGAMVMHISADSGVLLSMIKGQPVVGFKAVSEIEFYNKSNDAVIRFKKDANGRVTSFQLLKGKQVMDWERTSSQFSEGK